MDLKEYLKDMSNIEDSGYIVRDMIICNDGFFISIQASKRHYCTPRETLYNGEYTALELGFASKKDDLISQYAENPEDLTGIFPYVPIEVVEKLMLKHKGMISY